MKNFLKKEYRRFIKKSWFGKITDLLFILLLILLIIPASRKELMTYGSKIRMYLTSVETKEQASQLEGKNSMVFRDDQGNRYTLSDFLDKPVFINFWATWCPPCRAEMPTIEGLYKQYGGDVHFLIVSNQPLSKQEKFLAEEGYDFPYYRLISRPRGSFSYSVLPTSMVIAKNNRIILRKEGAVNWQSRKVKKIFNNLQKN
ncbi:MAG: TlpA family protein disulfide reductase [Bacteroidales bacterium]|nr:TlpA family protein disulfide reductase [Bacteroidales bacterium]